MRSGSPFFKQDFLPSKLSVIDRPPDDFRFHDADRWIENMRQGIMIQIRKQKPLSWTCCRTGKVASFPTCSTNESHEMLRLFPKDQDSFDDRLVVENDFDTQLIECSVYWDILRYNVILKLTAKYNKSSIIICWTGPSYSLHSWTYHLYSIQFVYFNIHITSF